MSPLLRALCAAMLLGLTSNTFAQPQEEEDLSMAYGDEEFVSIATGKRQALGRAPAVASVITDDDIKDIGATDLDQVLETVAGLHVSRSNILNNPLYTIRGIHSKYNPQVLILINGIPITNLFQGDRNLIWGGMPVNNVARIEVIRGPGSAIYGADAFSGVINIITKTKDDIDGTEIGVRRGSFDTSDAWLLRGDTWGGLDSSFSLQAHTTDGYKGIIDADAQTTFDTIFGTNASLAPGRLNAQRDSIDTRLDLSLDHWRLRLGYQGRRDVGSGAGVAEALDPDSRYSSDRINADLTYSNPSLGKNWDLTTQLSFLYADQENTENLVLYPAGANFSNGVFAEGVIGNPEVFERHWRFGISAFYTGFQKHRIRIGTGLNYGDLYKVKESRNYFFDASGILTPLPSLVDVSDTAPFLRSEDRSNYYFFLQDEWSFSSDWSLTSGLRYDDYSDFGNTLNPRLALVWQTGYNLTTKLLYGRAFRAPSFAEEFNINNPVVLGNPDLDPETIDTVELAFNYQPSADISTGLNLFHYEMRDIIRFVQDPSPATSSTAQNSGRQTGYGLEWETNWNITKTLHFNGNYAFQRSTDEDTDSDAANAPHHQLYARIDWHFFQDWLFNTQINYIADREREDGDSRDDIDDYTLVDLTLRYGRKKGHWEAAVSARNVFDQDAREPSQAPGFILNDIPLPGRSYFGEIRYRF